MAESPFKSDWISQFLDSADSWNPQSPQMPPKQHHLRGTRRSSVACESCRRRKVRCDVVNFGRPCGNCSHDGIDCLLPKTRRRKYVEHVEEISKLAGKVAESEGSVPISTSGSSTGQFPGAERPTDCQYQDQQESLENYQKNGNEDSSTPDSPNQENQGIVLTDAQLVQIFKQSESWISQNRYDHKAPERTEIHPQFHVQQPLPTSLIVNTLDSQLPTLPSVFAPLAEHLNVHDLTFLQARGAFVIPNEIFQREALKTYGEMVQPNLPLLDWDEFLSALNHDSSTLRQETEEYDGQDRAFSYKIPILLFQAVMYAATEFMNNQVLQSAGYESRECARNSFLSRAKLLYDINTCSDNISVIQSLLLLTFCESESGRDNRDSWHWLSLAIALCYRIGLNCGSFEPRMDSPDYHRTGLAGRLWWATFVRQRTLSLRSCGTWTHQVRIKREDVKIPMVSLQDFQIDREGEVARENAASMKRMLDAVLFIEKAKLCWMVDDAALGDATRFP